MYVKVGDITQEVLYPRDCISLDKFDTIKLVKAKNISISDIVDIQIN